MNKFEEWLERIAVTTWVIAALMVAFSFLFAGCSTTAAPYFDVGVAYRVDANTDWYLQGDRQWTGRNPLAHFELGLEFDSGWCGYHHWSSLLDGGHNNRPELYQDDIRCTMRFGGK